MRTWDVEKKHIDKWELWKEWKDICQIKSMEKYVTNQAKRKNIRGKRKEN